MTPRTLAKIHTACFATPRPWTAQEFDDLIASAGVFICTAADGFIMGRIIADEAELLTLAVMPQTRRTGIGTQLMQAFEAQLSKAKVQDVFLEVSCENAPAIALYQRFGYVQTGLRKAYYNTPDGRKIDAIVMGKSIF